jgi:hypothetical protein
MANEPRYKVTFQEPDIISAQRLRFIRSSKFKIIVAVWLVALLWGSGQVLFPDVVPALFTLSNGTLLGTALLFAGIVAGFYWLAPWIDFRTNAIWKSPFTFQFNSEQMMLTLEGRGKGVYIRWEQIRNVHENAGAYILYTSSEDNFLILPRSVFPDAATENRFRQNLGKYSSLKPADKELYLKP